ncbi:MAG: Calx-beta domain-containing protein, partial [Phycisphaerales bacterium]
VQANIYSQVMYRRLKGATSWGMALANLSTTQTTFADATAVPGVEYEYWMQRTFSGLSPSPAMGYISAGVKVPEVHARGTLLLLVDDSMVVPLAPEIAQLKDDLTADGWTVQQITAPRAGTPATTKALVKPYYDADPTNVKMLYILGHVPVPYSGNLNPDGHADHQGAWPADGYYGDMNGSWTDASVNTDHNSTKPSDSRNRNIPADGKFDQTTFPSLLELQVGRVDLSGMTKAPSSDVSETSLLRRYLRKAHDFRTKQGAYAAIPRKTLIRDGFGMNTGEPFAINGWAPGFTNIAQPPAVPVIDSAPADQWFTYATNNTYLLGEGNGSGGYEAVSSVGFSSEFGRKPSKVVFTSMFGSYMGDWDISNALMRAILAGNAEGTSLGLTCFWGGRPHYFVHPMGMGDTIGYSIRLSQNAGIYYLGGISYADSYQPGGSGAGQVHMGLMGDPALRLHMVQPPRNLAATSVNSQVTLGWDASTETSLQGYHVYRAATSAGPFTKLTPTPQAGTTYTDTTATAGQSYAYMVRTLKLESAPGGSYYNLSLGSTASLTVNAGATGAPANPSNLAVTDAGAITWTDNSSNETGFRIERKTNAGGAYATLAMVGANASGFADAGPFVSGNVYFYRVIATGADGASIASNEASFEGVAGFVEFPTTTMKVSKTVGTAQIPVQRFGGTTGAVTVNYTATDSSAVAGTHYAATSGALSWADGETGIKNISVPITNTVTPQQARQFRISLSGPSGGASISQFSSTAVLIEDPTATLPGAWTQLNFNGLTDSSPAVQAEGALGSTTLGRAGLDAGATQDIGQFIYQTKTGDGVLTAFVPATTPAQFGGRFAVM